MKKVHGFAPQKKKKKKTTTSIVSSGEAKKLGEPWPSWILKIFH